MKIYDLYSKRDAFNGETELMAFTEGENKYGSFTKGNVLYEFLTDCYEEQKFYTINQDDAEGNYVGYYDPIDIYHSKEDAIAAAERWVNDQDKEAPMGCDVMEWWVNADGQIDGSGSVAKFNV